MATRANTLVLVGALAGLPLARPASAGGPAADMVVVLDSSGSMGKAYKSEHYRDVLRWVKETGVPDDRIGVVTFGSRYRKEQGLESFDTFSPALLEGRIRTQEKSSDLASGLEYAYYLLRTSARPDAARWVLLFSDGQIDLPGGAEAAQTARRYLRDVLVGAMKRENIKVFAFMPGGLPADYPLLQEVTEGTGGQYFRGLPEDAPGFRRNQMAAWQTEKQRREAADKAATQAAADQASARATRATVTPPRPEDKPPALSARVLVTAGVALVVLVAGALLVVKPVLRARRKQHELASILDDVRVLREELVIAKAKGTAPTETAPEAKEGPKS